MKRPRVGLALAGGFARGIAHIGVLRVLREAAIPIDVVSGTSVGALIATAYCAGASLEVMERVAHDTKFTDFGRWTPSWLGLATNNRLEQFIARFTPVKRFDQLQKPLGDFHHRYQSRFARLLSWRAFNSAAPRFLLLSRIVRSR